MLSHDRKTELEDMFYAGGDPDTLTEDELDYWNRLIRQWNDTLNNITDRIVEADKRAREE